MKKLNLYIAILLIFTIMITSGCDKKPTPPVAQISATPNEVNFGESITFSGADSTDVDGNITSYQWDFGNGDTASGETVAYTYSDRGGEHIVKLMVTDNDGLSDTAQVSVRVTISSKITDIKIKIEITTSTWRSGEPDDVYWIYWAILEKLEKVGFEVMPWGSTDYDGILFVDYKEAKGDLRTIKGIGPGPVVGGGSKYETDITCNLRLEDKAGYTISETSISGYTPDIIYKELYAAEIDAFQDHVYFEHLGEIIASEFGIEDATLVEQLIQILEYGGSWRRQVEAAFALGEIGDARALEPLIDALQDENMYAAVRGKAAEALGKIGDPRVVEPLIQALNDEDYDVRESAAETLGKIGDARAVEPLIQALKDEDYFIRAEAAKALGEIGDARAVEPLLQAKKDKQPYVQKVAEEALVKIRGY